MNPSFLKPRYNSHCFSDLPATISYLLTGQGQPALAPEVLGPYNRQYDAVVLFFIDAFGWRFYERFKTHPFLTHLSTHGHVSQLTSQFPSTTAAHVTTIHTGPPVGQSGVFEWYYYEPQVDALIAPLFFSFAGTNQRETLKSANLTAASLYPNSTIYQQLNQFGIKSHVFQHRDYTPSTYSDYVFRGAEVVPYKTLPQALVNLRGRIQQRQGPSYYFLYFDAIDTIGHYHGPESAQFEAEVDSFLTTTERHFLKPLQGRLKNTLFILTADHGQVAIDPATTIYLNRRSKFKGIQQFLKTNRQGEYLVPGGSARDLFLYIHDDQIDDACDFLAERLDSQADVVKVQDLIEQGYFGPLPLSPAFLSHVGNLVVLPYAGESVWWYEPDKFEQRFYGHHGGLTPQEMEIPLLLYDFST